MRLLSLLLLLIAAPAAAQPVIQNQVEALAQDAAAYATLAGIAPAEALQRLQAQEASVAATDAIQQEFAARLSGIFIEHRPAYRIVVHLTGDAPVPDRSIIAAGMAVPIIFRTGAPASRAQLLEAIRLHQLELRAALTQPPALGVDPVTGTLAVFVKQADLRWSDPELLKVRLEEIAGVPVTIRAGDGTAADAIAGGARLEGSNPDDPRRYACTTGFVVTDGTRDGIVTAAHCPDAIAYIGAGRARTPLSFEGQWGWGYQDVQLHLAPQPLEPVFFADTAKTMARPVTTWRNRQSTRVGDIVCHRGERTGYSCAEVMMTDFAPAGDLCGGDCLPTWIAVAGPTCKGGDSGAPVFLGTVAFGLVKGGTYRADGSCSFYFYMSTDFLPQGWGLVHTGLKHTSGEGKIGLHHAVAAPAAATGAGSRGDD